MKRYGKTKYHAKDLREQQKSNRLQRVAVNRTYKNTVFQMVFHQKKELLELYNGLNNSHYTNEEDLIIVTLENAVYMSMKNDLAFVLDMRLHMYEHQSTHVVETAVEECIKEGILADFLRKNKAEAIAVSIFEYDEEKEKKLIRQAEREYGRDEERAVNIRKLVRKIGITTEQAMDMLDIPQRDRRDVMDIYRKNLEEEDTVSIFEYEEEKEIRLIKEAERDVEKIENIKLMMKNLNLTAEQAMEALEIPKEKRREYLLV